MKCGYCDKTDGLIYTSLPPKYKCTVSGRFHYFTDECDICHICGGNLITNKSGVTVCDKCDYCCVTVDPKYSDNSPRCMICNTNIQSGQVCDGCKELMMGLRDKIYPKN